MSLYSDLNEIKGLISSGIVIREYSSDWVEAYIPNTRRFNMTRRLREIAQYLEEKYSRPVHVYISQNKCMIRLR